MKLVSRLVVFFLVLAACWSWAGAPAHAGELKGRVVGLRPVVTGGTTVQEGVPNVLVQVRDRAGNLIFKDDGTPLQTQTQESNEAANQGKFTLAIPDALIEGLNFRVKLTFFKQGRVDVTLQDVNGKAENNISVVQPEVTDEPQVTPPTYMPYYCPPPPSYSSLFRHRRWCR